jgi:hypothetical protein
MADTMYPEIYHIGIVVESIEDAARANAGFLGGADFYWRFRLTAEDALYRGERVSYSADFALMDLGNIKLELIEPIGNDRSPYRDLLDHGGESFHHVAYVVPSINEHLDASRVGGADPKIILDARQPDGAGRYVYVEGLIRGTIVELIERWAKPAQESAP